MIIDPGGKAEKFKYYIEKYQLCPLAILNTQAHLDHIGAVTTLKTDLNTPFYLHQDELELLENANEYVQLFGMPRIVIPTVDYFFTKETDLIFNSISINIIFTPGHTVGGTSFMIEIIFFLVIHYF